MAALDASQFGEQMDITQEQSGEIEATLNAYVANPEPELVNLDEKLNLREVAAVLNVLPMYFDLGGCYGIRPHGEIISFTWDEPYKFEVEGDPRIWNVVLFQGVKRYPALRELVPVRPLDAVECPDCEGTGVIQALAKHGIVLENIVCYCGGVGWLPPSEP